MHANDPHIEALLGVLPDIVFSMEEILKIIEHTEARNIKKGEYFSQKGEVCGYVGILLEGSLKTIYETLKEPENISRFFYLPDALVVSSFKSFSRQIPSEEDIVAMEDSLLLTVSYNNLEKLYNEIPEMNRLGRYLAEESYLQAVDKIRMFQEGRSKEKVHRFFALHPTIWGMVPIKDIASYLRVNRNAVSKYYNSWSKK